MTTVGYSPEPEDGFSGSPEDIPVESILRTLVDRPPRGWSVALRKRNLIEVTELDTGEVFRLRRLAFRNAVWGWCRNNWTRQFGAEALVAEAGVEGRWSDFLRRSTDRMFQKILLDAVRATEN